MTQTKADRLRIAREKAGFASAQAAAEAFHWGVAGYRHHENGTRSYGPDKAKTYARAFKVKAGWLLGMDGMDDSPPALRIVTSDKLVVETSVAAGVWREAMQSQDIIEIDTPPPLAEAKRMGFTVEGRSMDLCYDPGTVLDCVSIFYNGVEPQNGDHVIVERCMGDLRELTVKEFLKRDGKHYLVPRSTQPEFQSEIEIGMTSEDQIDGNGDVQVIAFVVGVYPPRQLALLERLGKLRRISRG